MKQFKTSTKKTVAQAYAISEPTLVSRIKKKLDSAGDELLVRLGEWTGNGALLPDQVEAITELLGNPQTPHLLYSV